MFYMKYTCRFNGLVKQIGTRYSFAKVYSQLMYLVLLLCTFKCTSEIMQNLSVALNCIK